MTKVWHIGHVQCFVDKWRSGGTVIDWEEHQCCEKACSVLCISILILSLRLNSSPVPAGSVGPMCAVITAMTSPQYSSSGTHRRRWKVWDPNFPTVFIFRPFDSEIDRSYTPLTTYNTQQHTTTYPTFIQPCYRTWEFVHISSNFWLLYRQGLSCWCIPGQVATTTVWRWGNFSHHRRDSIPSHRHQSDDSEPWTCWQCRHFPTLNPFTSLYCLNKLHKIPMQKGFQQGFCGTYCTPALLPSNLLG